MFSDTMVLKTHKRFPCRYLNCIGASRLAYASQSSRNTGNYTRAIDVFSYGVSLLEMLSDSMAFDDSETPPRSVWHLYTRVLAGARLARVPEIPDFLWDLIASCWFGKAEDRPSFAAIVNTLRGHTDEWVFHGIDLLHFANMKHGYDELLSVKTSSFERLTNLCPFQAFLVRGPFLVESPQLLHAIEVCSPFRGAAVEDFLQLTKAPDDDPKLSATARNGWEDRAETFRNC